MVGKLGWILTISTDLGCPSRYPNPESIMYLLNTAIEKIFSNRYSLKISTILEIPFIPIDSGSVVPQPKEIRSFLSPFLCLSIN